MAISEKKEGRGFVGEPTFIEIGIGRVKCVETGHEFSAKELQSYARSKRCRSGLIDAALLQNKPPLHVFNLDPLSRSKLICKLTGDTINKTEEHIWKHMNGKRFLNKLERTESGLGSERLKDNLRTVIGPSSRSKWKEEKEKGIEELISEIREAPEDDSDSDGFWVPPGGTGSVTGSDSSEEETTQESLTKECPIVSKELSKRTKRMTIEIGPSSYATRKKKNKPDSSL